MRPQERGATTSKPKPKARKKAAPKRTSMGYDPYAMLSAIPAPNRDYQSEAAKIYQPAMDYLNKQTNEARGNASKNDTNLKNMYAGLVGNIQRQRGQINSDYNGAIGSVGKSTQAGVNSIDQTYDNAANEQMAMLKQLGIEAAAPDTLKDNTRDEAFFKSMLQAGGKSTQDMLKAGQTSSLEYNRDQANISRQSGVDARADNKLGLQQILGQFGGQKVDLQTQIMQQASKMQGDAIQQQIEQQKAASQSMQDERNWEMQQARLALDTSKFKASQIQSSQPQPTKYTDPWGKGGQLAEQLYDGNRTAAENAVAAVRDAIKTSGAAVNTWQNPNDLVRAVLDRNRGAHDVTQLTALATYLYKEIFGK